MSNPGPAVTTSSTAFVTPQSDSGGYTMGQSTTDLIGFYGVATPLAQQASSVDAIQQLINLGLLAAGSSTFLSPGAAINVTASTLTVTPAAHAGRVVTLNRAAGTAVTLPAATGTGNIYSFAIGTTITSNSTTITTGVTGGSSDSYAGIALTEDGATVTGYIATPGSGGSDVITLNGSTTGGFAGDYIELIDIAAGQWQVAKFVTKSTGTAATPFSHT